jgi:glycosyltransferase involved in cell wall biosynthesis
LINGSGVDLEYFAPSPLPEQPVFLMIARLLGAKGVREYAAAALRIRSRRSGARFLLAGYRDGGPDCIRAAELDGWVSEGLEYLGPLGDVRPAIRESSVYVLPSYREGTPRSVLEAMAMGRPIITADVPGCRETVVHGKNGLLVPPRDPESLAAAMESLIEQPGLRAEMGARSLELCRSKYDVDAVNTALLEHLGLLGPSVR